MKTAHAIHWPLAHAASEELCQRLARWYELRADLELYVMGETDQTIYAEKQWQVEMAADALYQAMRRWEAEP